MRRYEKPTVTDLPGRGDWVRKFRLFFADRYEVVGFKGESVLVRALRDGVIYRAEGRAEDPRFSEL